MENNNTPAVIGNEALAVLQTASEVLQRNQISVSKAGEVGQQIVALINAKGMSDALDEKCNQYLVKVRETAKAMNDRRSPVTQLMTQVAKQFTSLENELKEGKTVLFIQQQRNEWAKAKAEEKRKTEEAAKRRLAIDNEKVEIRKKVELDLIANVSRQIGVVSEHLSGIFNNAGLSVFEKEIEKIKAFPSEYTKRQYDVFDPKITAIYLSKEEVDSIVLEVKNEKFQEHAKRYWETIDDLKINLEGKAPARKKELVAIADAEKKNSVDAERLKKESEDRIKKEEEQQKAEADEKAKQLELQAQSNAEAAKMSNLFSATEAAIIPDQGKAQVRSSLKITVSHQAAWVEIFNHFMQIEGLTLGIDELGKKSLNQMKAACEKHATKTGELIQSKYIKYEEDFTAVNKA
jgi:hypothetical protein